MDFVMMLASVAWVVGTVAAVILCTSRELVTLAVVAGVIELVLLVLLVGMGGWFGPGIVTQAQVLLVPGIIVLLIAAALKASPGDARRIRVRPPEPGETIYILPEGDQERIAR